MEQGVEYYVRFITRFPDIKSLADAREEEVLKIWQGMGYYSRARNLHASARVIVDRWGGVFPSTYTDMRELKGIGDYSAASIASLAFDEPIPAIDGNVYRLMARYYGIKEPAGSTVGRRQAFEKAKKLMDKDDPGRFNQAMIEYGALVCKPINPGCPTCLFSKGCYAHKQNRVKEVPLKSKPVKIKRRYFHYLVISFNQNGIKQIIINKRDGNDIWKNLYDFPMIETDKPITSRQLRTLNRWRSIFQENSPTIKSRSDEFKHVLSHQVIHAVFYQISLDESPGNLWKHTPVDEIDTLPIPRLIAQYLQKYFH